MSVTRLNAEIERFPIAGTFTISRGAKTCAEVIHVTLERDGHFGHGECVPYAHYGETPEKTLQEIRALKPGISAGLTREQLQSILPPGAARNALDCAYWDLEAKIKNSSPRDLAGLTPHKTLTSALTISLNSPEKMADDARKNAFFPLHKLKLGGKGDIARLHAVREAAPYTRFIADANEAWTPDMLQENLACCHQVGIELVEQPLPANDDTALASCAHLVPICADESVHGLKSLADLQGKYDAVNIKLDKTGGLTEAINVTHAAHDLNFKIMLGCMVSTSLSIAPIIQLSGLADWIDLDGPQLLKRDRPNGFKFNNGQIDLKSGTLWG